MNDIPAFKAFLLEKGYQLIDDNKQLHTLVYGRNGLYVRLEEERNREWFISLSRTNNHSWQGWYDMTIIRCFVLKVPFEKNGPTRFEQLSRLFTDHYEEIEEAFSPNNFPITESALVRLQKERGKILFGYEE